MHIQKIFFSSPLATVWKILGHFSIDHLHFGAIWEAPYTTRTGVISGNICYTRVGYEKGASSLGVSFGRERVGKARSSANTLREVEEGQPPQHPQNPHWGLS